MITPAHKFAEHYARLDNDELLRLVAQKDSLLEVARQALGSELAKRGLGEAAAVDYQQQVRETLERGRREEASHRRDAWRRRAKTFLYVLILFAGDLVTVSAVSSAFNLPSEAVRILTKISLYGAMAVAALGIGFAKRWINLKTTLVTTVLFCLSLFLWVAWMRNQILTHAG